jgi:hypothetical protein
MVALVAALACVQPAQADDAAGAPAPDAAPAADGAPTAAGEQPAPEAAPADPAPTQTGPDPVPQEVPPAPTEPPASTEPTSPPADPAPPADGSGDVVTMEPADSTAAPAAGNEPACAGSSAPAQPATDGNAAAAAPSACPVQAETPPPSAAAPTVVAPSTAPPAAQPAAAADSIAVVVSLAPEDSAVTPADAGAAAGLVDPATETAVVASFPIAAVELAQPAVHVASLVQGELAKAGYAGFVPKWLAAAVVPPLAALLPYFPSVSGTMSDGTLSQEVRAAPRDRDGHRVTAAKAEQTALSATVDTPGPLEDQGPGTSGGSAGGSAGGASSVRFFAIATTPLRFDFPSSFTHSPLPSSPPKGALEDAPTTRPG